MPLDSKFYKKKKAKSFYYAVWFLILVLVLTWGLYTYNSMLVNANTDLDTDIARIDASVDKLQNEENIKAYSLYSSNKNTFSELTTKSQVPAFVIHIKKALVNRWLDIWSFNYSNGRVTVKITSESDTTVQAYEKVVKFLNSYRQDESSLFTLENITSVTGQDKITFDASFVVKK